MKKIFKTLLFLVSTITALGQSTECNTEIFEDPLLEKLTGSWTAKGQVMGYDVVYDFKAGWELNHQFMVLSFADTAKSPAYAAKVFIGYDCDSRRYIVHWLDNFGGKSAETLGYGTKSGDGVEFLFEYPDGPFINKFIFNKANNTWRFQSTAKNDKGEWLSFGDIELVKD